MTAKIESLTKEQEAKFPEYVEKWTNIGLSTDNSRCHDVRDELEKIYKEGGLECPKVIIHLDSPLAANYLINIIVATGEYDIEDPAKMTMEALKTHAHKVCKTLTSYNAEACYGQHDASWLAFYSFFKNECGLEVCNRLEGYYTIAEKIGWFFPAEEFVIVTKKPCFISRDEQGRLHNETDYAIKYEDGKECSFCAFHGVRVDDYVIFNPEQITVSDIENETNAEVRRVKITKYGQDRYLMDSNSKLIHEDDWGMLYKKDLGEDEPLVMVKVVNSTPEADGSFKDYFIRVRPDVKTAKEAVASTFLLNEDEYEPIFES